MRRITQNARKSSPLSVDRTVTRATQPSRVARTVIRIAAPILLISSCLASCVAARNVDPPNPCDLATTYASLQPMTKDPVFVEPALALLCHGVTPDEIVKARAAGGPHANGDREYFYFEDASAVESGRIAPCIACHRGAADRDFVFGDWARESARKMHGG